VDLGVCFGEGGVEPFWCVGEVVGDGVVDGAVQVPAFEVGPRGAGPVPEEGVA